MTEHQNEKDMRAGWNARALKDPLYYMLTDPKYRDIRLFNQAGIESAAHILTLCDPYLTNRDAVLDIGCGIGRVLKFMCHCFKYAFGCDVSDRMIEKAAMFLHDCPVLFRGTDGMTIEIPDSRIDLAYAMLLFEHFPSKDVGISLIRETYRVLAPGGLFFLRIATAEHGTEVGTSWIGAKWTEPEIVLALTDAGFQIVKATAEPHPNPVFTFRSIIGRKIRSTS